MIYTVNSPFGAVRVVALKGERGAGVEDVRREVAALKSAIGSPLVATTAAGMTDKTKVYVYTGSESGYTGGHWYYWNGTAWTDGGVYNSVAINTDTTLSISGGAADAAATGEVRDSLNSVIEDISGVITDVSELCWELGRMSLTTGANIDDNPQIYVRTKYHIAAKKGSTVSVTSFTDYKFQVCLYDSNKAFVSSKSITVNSSYTMPSDGYIRFAIKDNAGSTQTTTGLESNFIIRLIGGETISSFKEETKHAVSIDELTFSYGRINMYGTISKSSTYATIRDFVYAPAGSTIGVDDNSAYRISVASYSRPSEDGFIEVKLASDANNFLMPYDGYVRFSVRTNPEVDLDDLSLVEHVVLNIKQPAGIALDSHSIELKKLANASTYKISISDIKFANKQLYPASGKTLNSPTFVCTDEFIYAYAGSKIEVDDPSNYVFNVVRYSFPSISGYIDGRSVSGDPYTIETNCYVKFSIRTNPSTDQSDTSLKNHFIIDISQPISEYLKLTDSDGENDDIRKSGYYKSLDFGVCNFPKYYELIRTKYDAVTIVDGDTRSPKKEGWYEKSGNIYVPTRNKVINTTKTYYETSTSPDVFPNGLDNGGRDFDAYTAKSFYTEWNDLVSQYPLYFSAAEPELSSDPDEENTIRWYTYNPVDFMPSEYLHKPIKVIVIAGQHGYEKTTSLGLYYFVRDMLEHWWEDPFLNFIHNHVQLIMLPLANPYGFDHVTRRNAHDIDLNRNYPNDEYGFIETTLLYSVDDLPGLDTSKDYYYRGPDVEGFNGTTSTHTALTSGDLVSYVNGNWKCMLASPSSGPSAGSEPETQSIMRVINANTDAFLVMDWHNNGAESRTMANRYGTNWFSFDPDMFTDPYCNLMLKAAIYQIAEITNQLREKKPNMYGEAGVRAGQISAKPRVDCLLKNYAMQHGILGMTFETMNGFPNPNSTVATHAGSRDAQYYNAELFGNWLKNVMSIFAAHV